MSKRGAAHASNASAQAAGSGGAAASAHAHHNSSRNDSANNNNHHAHSSHSPSIKSKGTQRAKSGCYTCRIRRKKCDEKQDDDGNCQTCVRLRLQCLGFGAKRPDWMREGNSVPELRERIKNFLAEQGMIKGHSSTAARTLLQPPPNAVPPSVTSNASNNVGQESTIAVMNGVDAPPAASSSSNGSPTPVLGTGADPLFDDKQQPKDTRRTDSPSGHNHVVVTPPAATGAVLVLADQQQQYVGHPYMQNDPSHGTSATTISSAASNSISNNNVHSSAAGGVHGHSHPHPSHSHSLHHAATTTPPLRLRSSESPPRHGQPGYGKLGNSSGRVLYSSFGAPHLNLHTGPILNVSSASTTPYQQQVLSPDSPKPQRGPIIGDSILSHYTYTPSAAGEVSNGHVGAGAVGSQQRHAHHHPQQWTGPTHSQYGTPYGSATHPFGPHTYQPATPSALSRQQQQQQFFPTTRPAITHFANGSIDHPNPPLLSFEPEPTSQILSKNAPHESTFGALYQYRGDEDEGDIEMGDAMYNAAVSSVAMDTDGELVPVDPTLRAESYAATTAYGVDVYASLTDPLFVGRDDSSLVAHYLSSVRPMQFFLADRSIDDVIFECARGSELVRRAICYVASVHRRRLRESPPNAPMTLPSFPYAGSNSSTDGAMGMYGAQSQPPILHQLQLPSMAPGDTPLEEEDAEGTGLRIRKVLENRRNLLTEAEAMAGLQCISSYLFAGGTGGWDFFLNTACDWLATILPDDAAIAAASTGVRGQVRCAEVLERAGAGGEHGLRGFIVRTTMWFEVLASVSQVRRPRFLEAYRDLFGPKRFVEIVDGNGSGANGNGEEGEENGFSMLNVMGCDNSTFLAIAETSALAAWKDETQREGKMSLMELTRRGAEIEEKYLRVGGSRRLTSASSISSVAMHEGDTVDKRRQLTADVFRAAARLFVHTVLNEDNLACNEIVSGVHETVVALQRVPETPPSLLSSVVRSVVFPICLAGCMTDDKRLRAFLKGLLVRQQTAGNGARVWEVMETVWAQREAVSSARFARRSTSGLRSSLAASGGGRGGPDGKSWRDAVREVLLV